VYPIQFLVLVDPPNGIFQSKVKKQWLHYSNTLGEIIISYRYLLKGTKGQFLKLSASVGALYGYM
jgi:hypothetical protein